jgi:hypothetical protein
LNTRADLRPDRAADEINRQPEMHLRLKPARQSSCSAHRVATRSCLLLLPLAFLLLSGCGYHTSNHAAIKLPSGINTIAVPIFINRTNSYRAEAVLTEAVVREFTSRSPYKVLAKDDGSADAVLHGTVVTTNVYPLTYDSQTGRQSSAIVQINMSVSLVDKRGKTLFENPNYSFREQYQVSREVTSFFDESPPAVDRLSRDFARTLVAEILEGF